MCLICFENENKETTSQGFIEHKEKANNYSILKKALLAEPNTLCAEFDYAQNLPLPKLSVAEQYYKRK